MPKLTIPQAFPRGYTSYSQLSSYERCPWYFYRRYVCGVQGADSYYGVFGRAIHKVFEHDANHLLETAQKLSKEKMIEIYDEFWRTNDMCFNGDTEKEGTYYRNGLAMIDNYYQRSSLKILASEHEYQINIPSLGIPIKAVIDLVHEIPSSDSSIVIRDYKTGKPFSQHEANNSLQMSIYGMAIKQKYGVYPAKYEFDFLQNDSIISTHRKRSEIICAGLRIQNIIEKILNQEFEEKYENKFWCNNICDLGKARTCQAE